MAPVHTNTQLLDSSRQMFGWTVQMILARLCQRMLAHAFSKLGTVSASMCRLTTNMSLDMRYVPGLTSQNKTDENSLSFPSGNIENNVVQKTIRVLLEWFGSTCVLRGKSHRKSMRFAEADQILC